MASSIVTKLKQQGIAGVLNAVSRRLGDKFVNTYRRVFQFKTLVYFMREISLRVELAKGFELLRFDRLEDIPAGLFPDDTKFLFHQGSSLWVAITEQQQAAACVWTRPASELRFWYRRIDPRDILIYAAGTQPEFRRRGLMSAMFNLVARNAIENGSVAWTDCAVWNIASAHMMESAGFTYDRTVRTSLAHRL